MFAGWQTFYQMTGEAAATLTGTHLDSIAAGQLAHLTAGRVQRASRAGAPRDYGMCGRLTRYGPVSLC